MSHRCRSDLRFSGSLLVGALIWAVMLLPLPAFGQLTADDIQEMQRQGTEEGWTFEVSQNEATQYSLDQLCGMKPPENWQTEGNWDPCTSKRSLPERWDWREITGLPPIRNQGGCGSCWAFGTVGALECAIKVQDNQVVDLSEQWLVSCNRSGWGCDGGWWAHSYHRNWADACDSSGAVMEEDFPYMEADGTCGCPYEHPYHIFNWSYIGDPSGIAGTAQMKQAIMDYGPISVSCYVDNAFQAYHGGVFNNCAYGTVNHAVVLVGWDDTLGAGGAWILRNSWGEGWGDGGYMYIAYGCNMVGYGACYVDYHGGAAITSDIRAGWVPFDVNFQGMSGLEVDKWNWDFGDSQVDTGQAPTHTYADAGMYTVGLSVDVGGEIHTREEPDYIIALADTVMPISAGGLCGQCVEVPIYARNFAPVRVIQLPFIYDGDVQLHYDSFSTAGCRTDYFDVKSIINQDANNKRMTFRLASSNFGTQPDLEPGSGPIMKLYFSIPWQSAYGQATPIQITSYNSYTPQFSYPLLAYTPRSMSGTVTLAVPRGDMDGITGITVSDLTYLVNYVFAGGYPPYPPGSGDVNCSGQVEISDVTHLASYLFGGGPAPEFCY